MEREIKVLSLLLFVFIIYGCGSQKELSENYVSKNHSISDQTKTLVIISGVDSNPSSTDSLFEKIYQESSYLELLDTRYVDGELLNQQVEHGARLSLSDLREHLPEERFQFGQEQDPHVDFLLVAYPPKFNNKFNPEYQNPFTLSHFRPNQTNVEITAGFYVPPKRFSFREFMYEEVDSYFQTNSYFKARTRFFLYHVNTGELVFDVTFNSKFLPTKQFAKSWAIEQSYHYLINDFLEKPETADTHRHIFSD